MQKEHFLKLISDLGNSNGLIDEKETKSRACPLCNHNEGFDLFKKHGFRYIQCSSCKFVFVKHILKDNFHYSDDYWDEPSYYDDLDPKSMAWERSSRILKEVEKRFEGNKNISLLDIGCGPGYFLRVAKEKGYTNLSGVEINKSACQYVNDVVKIECHNKILEEIEFPENHFDVVILDQVLEHVEDPKKLIKSIFKILKPKGFLYIGVPNIDGIVMKILGKNHRHFSGWFHINYFRVNTLESLLTSENFNKIKSYTIWEELTPAVVYCCLMYPKVFDNDPFENLKPNPKKKNGLGTPPPNSEENYLIFNIKKFILLCLTPIDILCKLITNYFHKGSYIEYFGEKSIDSSSKLDP